MKTTTRLVYLLILFFVAINIMAQTGTESKKAVYLQLGASGGFPPNFSQPVFIPQVGFDATFGIMGFRANGQFFKTSPEFDINGYLDPIKSVLTVTNLKETNSNVLLGITPYLNIGKNAFSFQPGVGLKYLMQKGATATAVYHQTPGTTILKFPDGDADRNLLMIEPNIRASFGKPGAAIRFYVEAGYTLPIEKNEITYSSRSLTNVVDPRGNVDVKALLNSKQLTTTEKSLPAFASVGAGIQIKLFSERETEISRSNTVNNYGINDEGIKRTTSQALNPVNNYGINDEGIKSTGEPVIGAEVFVEQEGGHPEDDRIRKRATADEMEIVGLGFEKKIKCKTNEKGEFSFSLPSDQFKKLPEVFTLRMTIEPPKNFSYKLSDNASLVVIVKVKKTANRKFEFNLLWIKEDSADKANKGVFAVSGRNTA
ncbi:MAG: hypothetical protein Q7U47_03390 [Paludibacter sp.]|nr:hypothetical protein [Paludibacter sp.]